MQYFNRDLSIRADVLALKNQSETTFSNFSRDLEAFVDDEAFLNAIGAFFGRAQGVDLIRVRGEGSFFL
jgi:hypothetical protein